MCSAILSTSCLSVKALGRTACAYALVSLCWYLLANSLSSSTLSRSANLLSLFVSSVSSWLSSSTTLGVGTTNSTRLIASVP